MINLEKRLALILAISIVAYIYIAYYAFIGSKMKGEVEAALNVVSNSNY